MQRKLKVIALTLLLASLCRPAAAANTFASGGCGFKGTGQSLCYNAGGIIACPPSGGAFYGQDGNYVSAASTPSYTVRVPVIGSSVTVDNRTGLMWVTDPAAAGMGAQLWDAAVGACNTLVYAGYDDWRLPKVRELLSIVDHNAAAAPFIDTRAFPAAGSDPYWTSTTVASSGSGNNAWFVHFSAGNLTSTLKTGGSCYVRCVRGGPQ